MPGPCTTADPTDVERWAASGAMALTGRRDGPPSGPPAGLVPGVCALGARVTAAAAALGSELALDWLALLGERAALAGLQRDGTTSCGGGSRLLRCADGWVAVSLSRESDVELLPAWLGIELPGADGEPPWPAVAEAVAARPSTSLVERAALLGLPVGALDERARGGGDGTTAAARGEAPAARGLAGLLVVDLTSLWAGPLCGSLLALAGATVVKVEATNRPDGARLGEPRFFDLLNAGKRSVALDLTTDRGRAALARVLAAADVVVEGSRPRALEQLGILADDLLQAERGPRVWTSITGHGRRSPRVAFGDDAAVAGGLVVRDADGPCFCADAVADPVAGLAATAATLEALARGGRWLVEVPMAGVCASLAGPTLPALGRAAPPHARPSTGAAPPLGADTAAVLAAL